MPKAARTAPLSCLFAVNKPTASISRTLLNDLQPLFASSSLFADPNAPIEKNQRGKRGKNVKFRGAAVKIGQGGTLDPLADGVLVIGMNNATKHLAKFLDCTKEYRAIGLFGCSTDSYDSDGKRVKTMPFDEVTEARIEAILENYRGEIEQIPPIFSALKMDGKPLYEYARSGTPLPRPIPSRKVTVSQLSLLKFTPGDQHTYEFPKESLGEVEKAELVRLEKMVKEGATVVEPSAEVVPPVVAEPVVEVPDAVIPAAARPPTFEISMTVSSGTYVRSIIHDIAIALGTTAHVVKLTRTRQGEFSLNPVEGEAAPVVVDESFAGGCVEWSLLESAIKAQASKTEPERGEDGYLEWERELLHRCKEV